MSSLPSKDLDSKLNHSSIKDKLLLGTGSKPNNSNMERNQNVQEALEKLRKLAIERISQRNKDHETDKDKGEISRDNESSNQNNKNDAKAASNNEQDAAISQNSNFTPAMGVSIVDTTAGSSKPKDQSLKHTQNNKTKDRNMPLDSAVPVVDPAKQGKQLKAAEMTNSAEAAPKSTCSDPKLPQTEDGFDPQPWIKRRYTISQLLLLGEILPYVVCPRTRFDMHAFEYGIVHIPGLGNESTGNSVVDHQILTLNLRTEMIAFQYFSKYHYRYLERFKYPEHALHVKALWVEVRGSAGLRDHGGYRNAFRPKKYDVCVKEGLINEDQDAEIQAYDQRNNGQHQNNHHSNGSYRGRGTRGNGRGGSFRGSSTRGAPRTNFVAAMNQPALMENIVLPPRNPLVDGGSPTPIVGNDIAQAVAKGTGTLHDISKTYADIQQARSEIDHVALDVNNGDGEALSLIEKAKERLAEKKADITNKWGGVYGYTVNGDDGNAVSKPKGLSGNSTTQEQQMQYIQYMLQTPLAPVVNTTPAQGRLSTSLHLSQPLYNAPDEPGDA